MVDVTRATLDGDTPHECGVIHGERFADAIAENVETYLDRFEHNGVDRETARTHAERLRPLIAEAQESYAAEMRGVAEGSGLDIELVTLLNVRYEILFSVYAEQARQDEAPEEPTPEGCTSFGVRPDATADGRTYIGQNWDWIPDINIFLMDIRRPDVPNALAVTEAGLVGGKFGLNEHGIGFVVNGLVSSTDGEDPYGKPSHVAHRQLLEAERFSDAIGAIVGTDRSCSGNILIGHAEGEVIDIEMTPESVHYLYPEDGILTHANHFEAPDEPEHAEQFVTHSLCRGERIRRLLENQAGDIDRAALTDVLRDHFNRPGSICSHVDPDLPTHDIGRTNASVVMDLENRRLFTVEGPPCQGEYREHQVAR